MVYYGNPCIVGHKLVREPNAAARETTSSCDAKIGDQIRSFDFGRKQSTDRLAVGNDSTIAMYIKPSSVGCSGKKAYNCGIQKNEESCSDVDAVAKKRDSQMYQDEDAPRSLQHQVCGLHLQDFGHVKNYPQVDPLATPRGSELRDSEANCSNEIEERRLQIGIHLENLSMHDLTLARNTRPRFSGLQDGFDIQESFKQGASKQGASHQGDLFPKTDNSSAEDGDSGNRVIEPLYAQIGLRRQPASNSSALITPGPVCLNAIDRNIVPMITAQDYSHTFQSKFSGNNSLSGAEELHQTGGRKIAQISRAIMDQGVIRKRANKCGFCKQKGHNIQRCLLLNGLSQEQKRQVKRSADVANFKPRPKQYKCSVCNEEGHNRRFHFKTARVESG